MLVRAGYDKVVGRPTDPTGVGCNYRDSVYNDPNPPPIKSLVLNPVFDPVPALLVPSYCSDTTTCNDGGTRPVRYYREESEPQECITYQEQLRLQAERERKEAIEALLRESPVQSGETLRHDLEVVGQLTPEQMGAMRDGANNVVLTKEEDQSLKSITLEQWHAISQLVAFYRWLDEKTKEAQAQAEQERLAVYQSLMAEAATRQAAAAEWQAAAQWRQQQCLKHIAAGLQCY